MRHSTPFFAAFGPLLFGSVPRSKLRALLESQSSGGRSLSQFQEAFGEFVPQALLAANDSGLNSRQRIFTPLVTFWAFLAQVLERGSSCRDALLRIVAWWRLENRGSHRRGDPSLETSAYCQARARLEDQSLQQIGDHIALQMQRNLSPGSLWRGRRVKVIDGTGVSMPDTMPNQRAWPQPTGQKPGCGFPLLKLVGLFCLHTGALLQSVHGPGNLHDFSLARRLWGFLEEGDLVLADRGFCSFFDLCEILATGADALMRLHQRRPADFGPGEDDRLVVWSKPVRCPDTLTPQQYDNLPETLTLRLVRHRVQAPGFRTREVVLVTTLLDQEQYPAGDLARLYFQRWSVELHFREIKTLLGMDVLRCLSPAMIAKELAMHRIAYNLIRALMQRAAICHHVDLERLSFKGTLDALHHFADVIHATSGQPRTQARLLNDLLALIARDLVPLRPGRSEPRAKKRRPKNYILLSRPRRQMVLNQHRSRWRANHPKHGLT